MTAIGTTRPGVAYAQWKLRSERLIRASGNPYTIVRPGWFDDNQPDQRKIVMLQGDRRQSVSDHGPDQDDLTTITAGTLKAGD
ncbi:NAD(P)H-binding protein [Arthrobacter sp. SPG23]|uniref:NAD(P)H-binding protein n=1 Tax=Arthrobacter sp. SPG23 TaxID=1610703 RepID=UPI000A896C39|nr:NAD(P)H-binding protein [Arthrobacter sp. SPG23]